MIDILIALAASWVITKRLARRGRMGRRAHQPRALRWLEVRDECRKKQLVPPRASCDECMEAGLCRRPTLCRAPTTAHRLALAHWTRHALVGCAEVDWCPIHDGGMTPADAATESVVGPVLDRALPRI